MRTKTWILLLAIAALCAPLLLLGVWLSVIALLVLGLHGIGLDWFAAGALNCLLQAVFVWLLLRAMRRWWRNLTPRRAQAVLSHLLQSRA